MKEFENFSQIAQFYDQAFDQDNGDIGLYQSLVEKFGQQGILELACGTGRMLLPIARKGYAIDGLDISRDMLNILEKNLARENADVKKRVNLHQGNMQNFNLKKSYSFITIPFNSFQHMLTLEDRVSTLRTVKDHLKHDGALALDVAFPKFELLIDTGDEYLDAEWESSEGKVEMYFRRDEFSRKEQIMKGSLIFRFPDTPKKEEVEQPLAMHFFSYSEITTLFHACGYEVVEEYGNDDLSPLNENAKKMIFVLKLKSA